MAHRLLSAAYVLVCVALLFALSALFSGSGQNSDSSAAVASASEQSAQSSADAAKGVALLNVENGVTLAYKEPILNWRILGVSENEEKTEYAAVVSCYTMSGYNFTEIQFFKADGGFSRSVSLLDGHVLDWESCHVRYQGSSYRLTLGDSVFYCDTRNGSHANPYGQLLCSDGDYDLVGAGYSMGDSNQFSVLKVDDLMASMEMPIKDFDYTNSEYQKTFSLNSDTMVAALETNNIRYTLNFNTKKYTMARFYDNAAMGDPFLTTSDGEVALYRTGGGEAGDASWVQLVAKSTRTGEYTFLTYLENNEQCILGADNSILINRFNKIDLYDPKTLQAAENPFASLFGKDTIMNGIYYDAKNKQYLLAFWKDTPVGPGGMVSINAFVTDTKGNVLKRSDAVLRMGSSVDGCWLRTASFTPNKDGSFTLKSDFDDSSVTFEP